MKNLTRSRSAILVWLVGISCLLALAACRWPEQDWLTANFQTLLPSGESSHWVSVANAQVASDYAGALVWLIESDNSENIKQFSNVIKQQLEAGGYADPDYDALQLARWRALTETLQTHYRGLVTTEDYRLLERNPGAYFEQNRQLLYSPLGGFSLNFLDKDPSGLFANYLRRITPAQISVNTESDGHFSELLVVNVPRGKTGFTELPGLYNIYQSLLQQARQQQITLSVSGAPLYTAYGIQSAQREMSTIGLASLALLITLLLINLRSFSAVILTGLCIFAGVVAGLLTTVVVFQQIHIFTLVFGASLIGIAADYALHYLAHSRSASWTPALALGKVYGALRLSVLSSIVAFSTLLFLPFPGMRQIGLFMASGLVCSFLTVCLLFPALYRGLKNPAPLTGLWTRGQWYWPYSWLILLGLTLMAIWGIGRLPAIDDVRAFYASPPTLTVAQERISNVLSQVPDSRYLLLEAPDQLQLLRLEDDLGNELLQLQAGGTLNSFSGIGTLIPALETQVKTAALLASKAVSAHLEEHMILLGLNDKLQGEVLASIHRAFEPLEIDTLMKQALPVGIGGFLGCDHGGCASRIKLTGVNRIVELETLTARYPTVRIIDQVAAINTTMAVYRSAVSSLLLVAAGLIALLLSLAYGWRTAAGILATPAATCLFSLFLIGYWQGGLSLINMMAMLLLIGVSLDYAIFRAFTAPREQAATSMAITLSAATSILAFGILGLSDTPLIRSFGQTIALGLCFAWLFSWVRIIGERKT